LRATLTGERDYISAAEWRLPDILAKWLMKVI